MKRFASFLLAFVLVFSMAIPAFATENPQVDLSILLALAPALRTETGELPHAVRRS